MPSRRKITLSDEVKRAVLDEIAMDYQAWQEAEKRFKRRVYLATVQGVYGEEIAERVSVSGGVVSKWKGQGEQETRGRRLDGGTSRPGEREPVG